MFESKEEVERTMLALKIFPDIGHVGDVEQEEPDTDEEEYAPQVGRDFLILHPHMISNAKLDGIQKCVSVISRLVGFYFLGLNPTQTKL